IPRPFLLRERNLFVGQIAPGTDMCNDVHQGRRNSIFYKVIKFIILILFLSPLLAFALDDYSFDLSEIEKEIDKKPYTLGGYLEFTPKIFRLEHDSAFYKLNFYNRPEKDYLDEYTFKLSMNGAYNKGISEVYIRSNINTKESDLKSKTDITIDEGYLSVKPCSSFNISIGKKALKWGKGYAWNPVAFVGRPKNPDDPDLSLEGYIMATTDYIKTFSGPLQAISVTPVVIPVYEHVNSEFGELNNTNYAGKVYLLLYDTDIDFIFLKGNSRPDRFGADFSRNITSNFEIHGDFAYIDDITKKTVDNAGKKTETNYDAKTYLLGIRYLTESDTTFICEYYRNTAGITGEEMEGFFGLVDKGYNAYVMSNDETLMNKAKTMTEGKYGRPNPMRDYMYLRISQKEPFDILYFIPSITCIYNINDRSYSLAPEILYTGITNLNLRLKAGFLAGPDNSEFGEKQNDYRIELRAHYSFDAANLFD
ncbi:MAG: hypothetical protein U9P80_03685, partial [Thermodesulfobacteriota bacterium]|nr:hypothetical protein [Thermodesulfobacteriota bacterium]